MRSLVFDFVCVASSFFTHCIVYQFHVVAKMIIVVFECCLVGWKVNRHFISGRCLFCLLFWPTQTLEKMKDSWSSSKRTKTLDKMVFFGEVKGECLLKRANNMFI
jgi:hypothetical protein